MLRTASPVETVRDERRRRQIGGLILKGSVFLLLLTTLSIVSYCLLASHPIRLGSQVLLGPRCTWAVPVEWGSSTTWKSPLSESLGIEHVINANTPDASHRSGVQIIECTFPTVEDDQWGMIPRDATFSTENSSQWKVPVVVGNRIRKWGPFTLVGP